MQTSRHVEQVVSNLPPNFTCVHSWGHGGGAERDPSGVMEALVSLVGCVQPALLPHKQMHYPLGDGCPPRTKKTLCYAEVMSPNPEQNGRRGVPRIGRDDERRSRGLLDHMAQGLCF